MTHNANPATPLPWSIDHECISAQGQHISMAIGTDGASYADQKQNAAYIVTACNAYPQLVAALRSASETLIAFAAITRTADDETDRICLIEKIGALLRSLGEAQ